MHPITLRVPEEGSGDAENTDTNLQDIFDRVRSQLSEDRTPHVREATIGTDRRPGSSRERGHGA